MRAATLTVFPRGFPLVTPIVIRARIREGKTTRGIYARRRGSLFIDGRVGERRFRAGGAIDGENRSDGMSNGTTESIFAIGQMKGNRGIASLNFSQAFTARKEAGGWVGGGGPRNTTDFFMRARINMIQREKVLSEISFETLTLGMFRSSGGLFPVHRHL